MNTKNNAGHHGAGGAGWLAYWLQSGEQAAGPLLQAVQGHMDKSLCERLLFTLHRRMVGNGRRCEWFGNGQGGGAWSPTFQDALGAGLLALGQWRAGVALDGAAVGAAAVAWRAMVASIDSDNWGESPAGQRARVDFGDWLRLVSVGALPWEINREWWLEWVRQGHDAHKVKRRLKAVDKVTEALAAGRGRRSALAAKVKHAAVLMLSGVSADEAAAAAGFKASGGGAGRGGKVKAADRLAAALKRAGLSIVAKRGRWADDSDGFTAAKRRGGAAVDLAVTLGEWRGGLGADGKVLPFVPPLSSAVVPLPLNPLARAVSGLSADCVGESGRRVASWRAVLAVAGASLRARRLAGVVRQCFHRPAAERLQDAVLPVSVPLPVVADGARRSASGWVTAGGAGRLAVVGSWVRVIGSHFTVAADGGAVADGGGELVMASGSCLGFRRV
jgi:hypothetical protein